MIINWLFVAQNKSTSSSGRLRTASTCTVTLCSSKGQRQRQLKVGVKQLADQNHSEPLKHYVSACHDHAKQMDFADLISTFCSAFTVCSERPTQLFDARLDEQLIQEQTSHWSGESGSSLQAKLNGVLFNIQPGAVKLVFCGHWMHLSYMHQ